MGMFDDLKKMADKVDPKLADKVLNKVGGMIGKEQATESTTNQHAFSSHSGGGKKRAVLVGINYFGQKGELKGCINDVRNVHQLIKSNGYSDIRILTDDKPESMPTRANMINAFKWLVEGVKSGDTLFLHYSGHGSSQSDKSGDEADGKDETLCPVDYASAGMITDDDMHELVVKPLPRGVKLVAIFDCCHSGSILDLPYTYQPDGNNGVVVRQNTKEAIKAGFAAFQALKKGDNGTAMREAFKALKIFNGKDTENAKPTKSIEEKSSEADVIMFSGCMDHQTSADAHIEGESTGAMSWAILKVLNENSGEIMLTKLLGDLRGHLQGHYQQIPQMSTSHQMDVANMKFSLQ